MAVYAVLSFSASIEESGSLAINAAPAVATPPGSRAPSPLGFTVETVNFSVASEDGANPVVDPREREAQPQEPNVAEGAGYLEVILPSRAAAYPTALAHRVKSARSRQPRDQ